MWLEDWRAAGQRLDQERLEHLQSLDDDSAWEEAQSLSALVQPEWPGDEGEGLLLQQEIFRRARPVA